MGTAGWVTGGGGAGKSSSMSLGSILGSASIVEPCAKLLRLVVQGACADLRGYSLSGLNSKWAFGGYHSWREKQRLKSKQNNNVLEEFEGVDENSRCTPLHPGKRHGLIRNGLK